MKLSLRTEFKITLDSYREKLLVTWSELVSKIHARVDEALSSSSSVICHQQLFCIIKKRKFMTEKG